MSTMLTCDTTGSSSFQEMCRLLDATATNAPIVMLISRYADRELLRDISFHELTLSLDKFEDRPPPERPAERVRYALPLARRPQVMGGMNLIVRMARGKLRYWRSLKEKRQAWGFA